MTDPTVTTARRAAMRAHRYVFSLLAVAALGAGTLAGCGSSSSSSSNDSTSSSAAASASTDNGSSSTDSSSSGDTATFLQAIHTQQHFSGLSDDQLTMLGSDVCKDFSSGNSLDQTENDVLQGVKEINGNDAESGNNPGGNLDAHDAGFLIGASVKALCPQYSDKLPSS